MTNSSANFYLRNFAAALVAGEWTPAAIRQRAGRAWPRGMPRWKNWLVGIRKAFPEKPSFGELAEWLNSREVYRLAFTSSTFEGGRGRPIVLYLPPAELAVCTAPVTRTPPPILTFGQLADFLGLSVGRLTCYADVLRFSRFRGMADTRRHNYRYRTLTKKTQRVPPTLFVRAKAALQALFQPAATAAKLRLLEIPKPRLMAAQRKIYADILALIPVHAAAHGFVPGRSILTNAAQHVGREVVIRFDLKDFFPSVPASRVRGIFARLGYPPDVARLLLGLCTTVSPAEGVGATELYARPHLPQGAPTSPVLANLVAYRLDCRLTGLAKRFGATYTRYADDLTFSGGHDLRRATRRLQKWVVRVVTEEGFTLNAAKTRVKSAADRQTVTGLVVNAKPNVRRLDFDRLKAILTNCVRHGPASQNRDKHPDFRSHLLGHVGFVAQVNTARGAKLRKLFDRIDWVTDAGPGDKATAPPRSLSHGHGVE
jgi:RNA-directed DNA polymerase